MTKNILALVGALAIVVLIGGAAYKTFGPASALPMPTSAAPFQQTPPKAISQIPITQHFSMLVGEIGPLVPVGGIGPLVQTMPSNVGLAISRLSTESTQFSGTPYPIVIRVGGVIMIRERVPNSNPAVFDPPIIVPPNQSLEVFLDGSSYTSGAITLSGYVLLAADFGL